MSSFIFFIESGTVRLWLFPKVKMKGKDFKQIQGIKTATTVQLKTQWRTSRTVSESGKNDEIQSQGEYLKGY